MTKQLFIAAALSTFLITGCIDTEGAESDDSTELSSVESNSSIYPDYSGTQLLWQPLYHQHMIMLSRYPTTVPSISSRTDHTQEFFTFRALGNDTYTIKNNWSGYCLVGSPGLYEYVRQTACTVSAPPPLQQWHLEHGIDGYTIRNLGSQHCIDTAGTTDSSLMQDNCVGDSGSEQWKFQ